MAKMMLYLLLLPSLYLKCISASYVHSMESSTSKCSDIPIPYPFGIIGGNPAPAQGFEIRCASSGPMVRINNVMFGVLNISLLDGFVSILASATSQQCKRNSSFSLEGTNFTFSDTRNKFTAVGCDMVAMLLNGSSGYSGGCASFCSTKSNIIDGVCSGVACCQASVLKGLKKLELEFTNITGQLSRPNKVNNTPICAEAFIVEQNSYVFSSVDLSNMNRNNPQYRPVVLEWSIDGGYCQEANRSMSYACKANSYYYNSSNGIGYRCNCTIGFQGNPYLQGPDGCQGMRGDGLKEDSGCNGIGTLLIGIVTGLALLLLLLILIFWTHWLVKKRKLVKIRLRYFMQNGGMLLKQKMFSQGAPLRIFTSSELDKATGSFSGDNIIKGNLVMLKREKGGVCGL